MSYGPDGLCPENLSVGYAKGAIGSSIPAALGVLVLIVAIPMGLLFIVDGDLLQGLAWMGGGIALAISLFGLAARRDRWMNRSPAPVWYLDRHSLAISLMLMLVGVSMFLVGREHADEGRIAIYTGGFGVAVFVVALLWFSLSVRD